MIKTFSEWWRAHKGQAAEKRKQEIISEVNDKICIADQQIEGCQAIALLIDGVVIDYTTGMDKKATFDPDGYEIKATTDSQRLISRLLNLRKMEYSLQLKKHGL